ncbi:MAG: MYG1 family protein [Sandaracinaceae bacterium]
MLKTILTHPGGAHKDDFLAVCLLAAKYGAPIVRRNPTEADLADPAVAIVDVGGEHAPERMNFDHHHFPREHPPTCALSLVLAHYDLYEDAKVFCDWLEPAEWFDSRGPKKTAEMLGIPRRAVGQLHSPIDVTMLRRFAAETELAPGQTLYEVMRFVGEDLLTYLATVRARIAYVEERGARWTLNEGDDVIEAVFLPRTDPPAEEPSATVAAYVRAKGLAKTTCALVYPDRRGPGYGISRWEDHPKLDFCRVEGEDDVKFAHKSGFVCKTTATEPERLKALIVAAWG